VQSELAPSLVLYVLAAVVPEHRAILEVQDRALISHPGPQRSFDRLQ
jgi:hypothetical protein